MKSKVNLREIGYRLLVIGLTFLGLLGAFNTDAQQRLFWCDSELDQIKSSKIDGTDVQNIISGNNPRYHAIDFASNKIYWTDLSQLSVFSTNLDGSNQEVLVAGLSEPQGISIGADGVIYIVDQDKISSYNAQGDFLNHIHENLTNPTDLLISNNQIYWGDRDDHKIERSALDGSSRETILNDTYRVNDIDINLLTNQIYWNQSFGGTLVEGIYKADLINLNKELVTEESGVVGLAVDMNNDYLYWGEYVFNKIHRLNLADQSDEIKLINEYLPFPRSIVLDEVNNTIYYLNLQYADFLFKADLDNGSNILTLASSKAYNPTQLDIDTINNKIYWINNSSSFTADESASIARMNIDGTGFEILVGHPTIDRPGSLALDLSQGKMYWTDFGDNDIKRANLDGSDIEVIISDDLSGPKGLAIDPVNGKMYWTDFDTDKIQRANLDGSGIEDIISTDLDFPWEITVSPIQSKIYWTDRGLGTFNKADLNGDNREVFYSVANNVADKPNTIHLDEIGKNLYFSIDGSLEIIIRSDFDGNGIVPIILDDIATPEGLFLIQNFYADNDNDGFTSDLDCDDDNPLINPDAVEIPNNSIDEDCDGEDLISNLQELNAMNINIYPTIFNRNIYVESKELKSFEFYVLDLNGSILKSGSINTQLEKIELDNISAGIYFIQLISPTDGLNHTAKIVKN